MTFLENIPKIITFIFLLAVLSYYTLLFIKQKKPAHHKKFYSITIIIPAHNEERYIKEAIESVLAADFGGSKEIIVINDGSKDNTAKIASQYKQKGVILINTEHSGKSASMNRALAVAKGELIAIVDGDSCIHKNALEEMAAEVGGKNVAGASGVVKVKNRRKFLCIWPQIELLYNSLIRSILSKIGANIVTPGPLAMYRKKELMEIGGFSTEGFSEDIDVTIRLIRRGYLIGFSDKAISETNMPYDIKGFFRQRMRFARGMLNIFKRHLQLNTTIIDLYSLPLLVFAYVQAAIMGTFTIYQIISGYLTYFASAGNYLSLSVIRYLFDWISIIGFAKWSWGILLGSIPLNFINITGVVAGLLSYPLFIYAILRYDKKLDFFHLIPLLFMAPFWWLITLIYLISIPEILFKKQHNIWKKND